MRCAASLPKLEIFPPAIRAFAKKTDAAHVVVTLLAMDGVAQT
jgi:hypothetical protein